MKTGKDIKKSFPGLTIIHHNLPNKTLDLHKHEECHLFIPLRGSISVKTEEKELKSAPGSMIYVPKNVYHAFCCDSKVGERLIVYLSQSKLKKLNDKESLTACKIKANQLVKEMIFYLLSRDDISSSRTYINLIYELIAESLDSSSQLTTTDLEKMASASGDKRASDILKYIGKNHRSDIRILDVAKSNGMSSRTLTRVTGQVFGVGPKDILMLYRMESAIRLLSDKSKNVTEVAFEVGFNHLGSFIQAFSKYTGKLPSDWKRR